MDITNGKAVSNLARWNFWLMSTAVIVYFFVNFQRSAIPGTIFNELQSSFNATAGQVTLISAAFMYVYAATQLLAGLATDKFGGVRVIIVSGLLFVAGSMISPLCGNLGILLFSRVLVGLGAGGIYLAIVKELDRLYPEKFTALLGAIILLGYSGSIFGGLPLSKAVAVISWRKVLILVAVLSLLAYIGFIYCRKHIKLPEIRKERISLKPFWIVLASSDNRWLLISGGVGYTVYYLMLAIVGKKVLEDVCGTAPAVAGACLSLMVVVSGGMNFLNGYLSTRWGNVRKPFMIGSFTVAVIGTLMGLIGLQINAGTAYFFAVMLFIAASAGFSSISNSLVREYTPSQYTGSGTSVINCVAYLGVAVVGNLAGYLMEFFGRGKVVITENARIYPVSSYEAIFILSLIISVVALAGTFKLKETYGKNICKQDSESKGEL